LGLFFLINLFINATALSVFFYANKYLGDSNRQKTDKKQAKKAGIATQSNILCQSPEFSLPNTK